jgi:ribosome biogenesis protein ERB1
MRVKKLVALLREGKILPPAPPAPKVWDLWGDDAPHRRKGPPPLPAPKAALPGHAESYNPPSEYLFSEQEKKDWEEQDEQDRTITTMPQKFDCLRRVPAYKDFIQERFKRCLDLYLVPRALRQRMNVDPDSLLPKLPSPKDLRPFPTRIAVSYDGHTGMVRGVAVDASGQWIATVAGDKTLRIWEISSGRCFRCVEFEDTATAVAWNPNHHILAVAANQTMYFLDPGLEKKAPVPAESADGAGGKPAPTAASLLVYKDVPTGKTAAAGAEDNDEKVDAADGAKARAVRWQPVPEDSTFYKNGFRIMLKTDGDVQQLVWHHKGNYCAAVSPKAHAPSNQCIIHALAQQKSMRPFSKLKGGQVQSCAFHPTKPHFFVATMRGVRVYDLQKQQPLKHLISGAKWIGSITVHPSGDHVVVGSYDRRIVWFDLDFAQKPFKTLQYHDRAVRRTAFHPGKFPLLAASSDDGTVSILHAKVFNDLMQAPVIVPVKRLRDHVVNQGLGVLDCTWHPSQPWLFTAGADSRVFLWA